MNCGPRYWIGPREVGRSGRRGGHFSSRRHRAHRSRLSGRISSVQQQAQIAEGELALDALTRTLIHDRYEYRFITTPYGAAAFALERAVQRGALSAGKPFLNPA